MLQTSILYNPLNVGKTIINKRNQYVKVRKYHLTDSEIENCIQRHIQATKDVPESIKNLCSPYFFNPFRRGIYWCQVQSLYLLGCNQWHNLRTILIKVEEIMRGIKCSNNKGCINLWEQFNGKFSNVSSIKSKDFIGRVQENFIFMQRLGCNHPSGYKLRQACAALDLKRVSRRGFSNGIYFYRLSTYSTEELCYPIRDFSEYSLNNSDYRFFKKSFCGVIII